MFSVMMLYDIRMLNDDMMLYDVMMYQEEMAAAQAGPAATDQVILATAGYDHTIKFWAAHTGVCTRTHQHPDSQVVAHTARST